MYNHPIKKIYLKYPGRDCKKNSRNKSSEGKKWAKKSPTSCDIGRE